MELNFSLKFGEKKEAKLKSNAPGIVDAQVIKEPEPIVADLSSAITDQKFEEIVQRVFKEFDAKLGPPEQEKPILEPGRESVYEGFRNFFPQGNAPVPTNFDFRILQFLKYLSMYNPHVSMGVDNVVTLGNTDYDIDFGETIDQKVQAEYRKFLASAVCNWYEFSDGEDGLDNDILTQLAVYGAISAETVIATSMRDVQGIVRVDPYYIRFAYDQAKSRHIPLQQVGGVMPDSKLFGKYPGYIELNPYTYSYIAMRRMGEMPYAIPPFAAAIEAILIENDMVKNLQNMMRRVGMMGFLSVLVKAPVPLAGENQVNYTNRLSGYLEKLRPSIEKGFSRGIVMGFKDTHEFEVTPPMNASSAEQTMKIVKALVYSGLKQDPNMHGENYSVTETFGRVVFEKMVLQIGNYQRALGAFKARAFKLALLLRGVVVPELYVNYKPSRVSDDLREQQVLAAKIGNARLLFQDGVIDQYQRAQMLGYDEPAEDQPLPSEVVQVAQVKANAKSGEGKAYSGFGRLKKKLGGPDFDYTIPEGYDPLNLVQVGDFHDPFLVKMLKKYVGAVEEQYQSAIDASKDIIFRNLNGLPLKPTFSQFAAAIVSGLLSKWDVNFSAPVEDIVNITIPPVYQHYRGDKSIFDPSESFARTRKSFFVVPDAVFELIDARAIEFLETIDRMYLGKFITDKDTERRIMEWLREEFETGHVPLGRDSDLLNDFIDKFADQVNLESWKIRRIIETTANNVRNSAHVNYLNQAQIIDYEVVEIMDSRTCGWCKHMNGKIFSVSKSVSQQEKMYAGGVDSLPRYSPFATTIELSKFQEMDARSIQAKGIRVPAHCHCRGRIVAHFK